VPTFVNSPVRCVCQRVAVRDRLYPASLWTCGHFDCREAPFAGASVGSTASGVSGSVPRLADQNWRWRYQRQGCCQFPSIPIGSFSSLPIALVCVALLLQQPICVDTFVNPSMSSSDFRFHAAIASRHPQCWQRLLCSFHTLSSRLYYGISMGFGRAVTFRHVLNCFRWLRLAFSFHSQPSFMPS